MAEHIIATEAPLTESDLPCAACGRWVRTTGDLVKHERVHGRPVWDTHAAHIEDDTYDDDCRECSEERAALIAEMNRSTNRENGSER